MIYKIDIELFGLLWLILILYIIVLYYIGYSAAVWNLILGVMNF